MKNLHLFIFILANSVLFSCKSRKTSDVIKSIVPNSEIGAVNQTSTVSLQVNDTVKNYTFDTIPKPPYDLRVVVNTKTKDWFRQHFVKNICEPGNISSPIYLKFTEKGAQESEKALNILKNSPSVAKHVFSNTNGTIDFSTVKLIQIPVYFVTPNVVMYENGQNIKQYYNLDTEFITYMVLVANKPAGVINYYSDYVGPTAFYGGDILSYYNVISLSKKPYLFFNAIKGTQGPILRKAFGYVQNDRIIFSLCSEESHYRVIDGVKSSAIQTKECQTQIAESYFAQLVVEESILTSLINNTYKAAVNNK